MPQPTNARLKGFPALRRHLNRDRVEERGVFCSQCDSVCDLVPGEFRGERLSNCCRQLAFARRQRFTDEGRWDYFELF